MKWNKLVFSRIFIIIIYFLFCFPSTIVDLSAYVIAEGISERLLWQWKLNIQITGLKVLGFSVQLNQEINFQWAIQKDMETSFVFMLDAAASIWKSTKFNITRLDAKPLKARGKWWKSELAEGTG